MEEENPKLVFATLGNEIYASVDSLIAFLEDTQDDLSIDRAGTVERLVHAYQMSKDGIPEMMEEGFFATPVEGPPPVPKEHEEEWFGIVDEMKNTSEKALEFIKKLNPSGDNIWLDCGDFEIKIEMKRADTND